MRSPDRPVAGRRRGDPDRVAPVGELGPAPDRRVPDPGEPDRHRRRRRVGSAGEPDESDPGPVGREEVDRAVADVEEPGGRDPELPRGPPEDRGRRLRVRSVGGQDDRVEEPGAAEPPEESPRRLGGLVEDVRDDADLEAAAPEPPQRAVDPGVPPEVRGSDREGDRVADPPGVRPDAGEPGELGCLRGERHRVAHRFPPARPLLHRADRSLGGPERKPTGDERLDPRRAAGPLVRLRAGPAEREEGEPEVDGDRERLRGRPAPRRPRHGRRPPNARRRGRGRRS